LVKDFLANNIVTTLEHPSCSTDLAAADFYLFRGIQSALQGRRFVMLLPSFRMRWRAEKDFYQMASRKVSNIFKGSGRIA